MTASTNEKPQKPKGEGGGAGAMAKGILIMLLLIIGAGAGGYFFGTFQKFAPIENVAPGTAGAQSTGGITSTVTTNSALKKKYWLATNGYDHVGYSIKVLLNGQEAGQFFTDGREQDVTKFVKQGENTITFDAKVLPEGMREHAGQSAYYLTVHLYSGNVVGTNSGRDEILKYTRNASEFDNHNDTMTFITLE